MKSLSFILVILVTTAAFAQSPVSVETVRADLLSRSHIVPEDVIKSMKPGFFKFMYGRDLCFVHIPYKSYAGEAFMQSTDMIVYRKSGNAWNYENLVQTWYKVDMLDSAQLIFLADVEFCEPTGSCQTYKSVSQYDGRSMVVFREYNGFDKSLYYDHLLDSKKTDELKTSVGQKVSDTYTLFNFAVQERQTSFTLKHKVSTIAGIGKDEVVKKVVLDKSERVIVNH